jgi:undecaprenyl-diphosphatase
MSPLELMLAWDELAMRRIHELPRRAPIDRVMIAVTRFGDAGAWVLMGASTALLGGARGRRLALRGTAGVGLAALAAAVLKRVLNRPRPRERIRAVRPKVADPDAFSFPSGHTAAAVAAATAFTGTPLGPIAWPFAGAMALSRVYLGAHYPLDVLVGAAIGAGTGLLARLLPVGPSQPAQLKAPEGETGPADGAPAGPAAS